MSLSPNLIAATTAQAKAHNVEPARGLAFIEVESGGQAFFMLEGSHRALIRYEGHYLWRRLPPELREEARRRKLAHPSVGGIKNPIDQSQRYGLLKRAETFLVDNGLDPDLAYECVSIGLGQVMGAHWENLGYSSAKAMLSEAHDEDPGKDKEDQIDMMFRYLEANDLLEHLRRGNWARLALGYNGPGYARNRYDVKLKTAFEKWAVRLTPGSASQTLPTVRLRSKGPAVKILQQQLGLNPDGIFGPITLEAVQKFQRLNGLTSDGIVGPKTWQELKTKK